MSLRDASPKAVDVAPWVGAALRDRLAALLHALAGPPESSQLASHTELQALCRDLATIDEQKLAQLGAAAAHLRGALNGLLEASARGLTARQHRDLRTVIAAIYGSLRALDTGSDGPKADDLGMAYSETSIVELFAATCRPFAALAVRREVSLTVGTPNEPIVAQLDCNRLERVLCNLLFNATKHTPRGGRITCSLTLDGNDDLLHFVVSDSGPGVLPVHREAIFERRRVLDRSAGPNAEGLGLSLADSRIAMELHGGQLGLAENEDGGAEFYGWLPRWAPTGVAVGKAFTPSDHANVVADLALQELEAEAALQPGGSVVSDKPLVLVVEDNRSIHRMLVDCLAGDFAVASAFDGVEGLQQALRLRPDLIITDLVMPRLDGAQLLRSVREHADIKSIPVLVLTAREDVRERVALLSQGAQDFIGKPFFIDEVKARIHNLVSAKQARDILGKQLTVRDADLVTLASQVIRRQDELRDALEAANAARDMAQRANRAKTNFLRMMSHELRTPLTAMQLHMRLLDAESQGGSERQRELVERQRRSLDRLLHLVESVLQYARIEDGRFKTELEPLDLITLTKDVAEELRPIAKKKGIELRTRAPSDGPRVLNDERLVRLVTKNLLGNAIALVSSGFVQLTVGERGGVPFLQVSDSGPGLTVDEQAELLQPLQHVDDVRERHGFGSGLGLTMVKEMVRAMGGELTVDSLLGSGTTFTVTVPSLLEREQVS